MSDEIIKKLKEISLFKSFKDSHRNLELVANIIEKKPFKKGEFIIEEGKPGSEMYILSKGTVHIERKTLEDDSYRIVTLSSDMSVFFGEQALMDDEKRARSATVIAGDNCEVFVITQEDFFKFGNEHPKLGLAITREITKKISADLRKANKDIITLFEALVGELEEQDAS